jgi:ribosomal protein S18 acetylase RimI-like enzyme
MTLAPNETVRVRHFQMADWAQVWPILRDTFAAGDTYAYAPDSSEADVRHAWIDTPAATFVAHTNGGRIVGTYVIKPNQPGLGAHVCNCGYVVAEAAQGLGVATLMCAHSQVEAVSRGFRAMQFNLVIATNERAVRLWQKLGYAIAGRLPGAFKHSSLGYVDALVMYKTLV